MTWHFEEEAMKGEEQMHAMAEVARRVATEVLNTSTRSSDRSDCACAARKRPGALGVTETLRAVSDLLAKAEALLRNLERELPKGVTQEKVGLAVLKIAAAGNSLGSEADVLEGKA